VLETERGAHPEPSLNSQGVPENRRAYGSEVLGAWGEWLSSWRWDWFVTLTYDQKRKGPQGRGSHDRVGWSLSDRHWHEWLGQAVGDSAGSASILPSVYWVRGREPNPWRYGTHFHALIGGVPTGTSRRDAWAAWFHPHGRALIEPYDPRQGAGYYVSKYVVKDGGDIKFSESFERFKSSDEVCE
jgi:hypothetical protein